MSGFLGSFFERNEKQKKDKFKTKQQQVKQDHKMQTTKPLSPVLKKRKTRQHSHKTIQIKCLKWKQTTQEKHNQELKPETEKQKL